jgi:His/Glu/Gln/Arg/opine family amino acid ABC transporter permease subunit
MSAAELIAQSAPLLLKGAVYTVLLSVIGMSLGLALGFGLALMRLSRSPLLAWPAAVYVSAFRGTPLLVQLFLIYYGLPQFGLELPPLLAAGIGFSLNVAAYAGEILRSAIAAVDKGQWEAATVLGLTRGQAMRRIILPQAARTAVAPLDVTTRSTNRAVRPSKSIRPCQVTSSVPAALPGSAGTAKRYRSRVFSVGASGFTSFQPASSGCSTSTFTASLPEFFTSKNFARASFRVATSVPFTSRTPTISSGRPSTRGATSTSSATA